MRCLITAALMLAPPVLAPMTASAHAILKESTPPDRASVPAGERALTLRYNSRIDHARSRLRLDGANAQIILSPEPDSPPDALVARVDLTPGDYVIHWQVLATDGHLTHGDLHLTVTAK